MGGGGVFLDVSCGPGIITSRLAENLKGRAVALALTPGCHSIGYMDMDHTICHQLNHVF